MLGSLVTLQQGGEIKTGLSAPRCLNQGSTHRMVQTTYGTSARDTFQFLLVLVQCEILKILRSRDFKNFLIGPKIDQLRRVDPWLG